MSSGIYAAALFHHQSLFQIKAREVHDRRNQIVLFHGAQDVFEDGIALFQIGSDQQSSPTGADLVITDGGKPCGGMINHHQGFRIAVT